MSTPTAVQKYADLFTSAKSADRSHIRNFLESLMQDAVRRETEHVQAANVKLSEIRAEKGAIQKHIELFDRLDNIDQMRAEAASVLEENKAVLEKSKANTKAFLNNIASINEIEHAP
jgi:hypothetical protein